MTDAKLQDMENAHLEGMQADDAILIGVTLAGANFNPGIAADGTEIPANFRRVLFHNANLQRTQFRNAVLEGAQFGSRRQVFRIPCSAEESVAPGNWKEALARAGFEAASDGELLPLEPGAAHLLRGDSDEEEPLLVRCERRSAGTYELVVSVAATPANISKAYLAGANLMGANLEGVTANGAHIYGGGG